MKKIVAFVGAVVLSAGVALAGEMPAGWAPPKISPELERVKALAGKWTGTSLEKTGDKPVTVTYQVTAGGSAVVETIDPGMRNEMITVYHDKSGKLSMTHYCMLGNQPELDLKSSTDGKLELDMSPESHAALANQMHMHSLTLETASDSLTQTWTAWSPDGKAMEPSVFKLHRFTS